MLSIYTVLKCKTCMLEFVLLSEDIKAMSEDRYLTCPYCNSKRIIVTKANDSLKECMSHSAYQRVHGKLRQVKYE
ncbi:hypothetical protein [Clostridium sp. CF012]|uniref:hypothetical protein n=1 Tax=Clostridium sp. CF012 TaxID=2843319 RepID=UPI001C0D2E32|nr:hypothetical protein [Clostridium sp. CF012]MBU3145739.1 hypothetical protein [Clostridium sp. CF012]